MARDPGSKERFDRDLGVTWGVAILQLPSRMVDPNAEQVWEVTGRPRPPVSWARGDDVTYRLILSVRTQSKQGGDFLDASLHAPLVGAPVIVRGRWRTRDTLDRSILRYFVSLRVAVAHLVTQQLHRACVRAAVRLALADGDPATTPDDRWARCMGRPVS